MQHRHRFPGRFFNVVGLFCLGLSLTGCANSPFSSGQQLFEVSLVVVSGDQQVLPSGGTVSAPLVVRVLDQHGTAYRDVTVDWKVVRGAGTLSAASNRTDSNGQAQVTYASGSAAEDTEITATASYTSGGLSAGRPIPPVSFKLTVSSATGSGAADDV